MEKENFFENKGENNPEEEEMRRVPEDELEFIYSRSSGKGGQNVNKVSSKVTLKWNVFKSREFSDEEKAKIEARWGNRIDKEGEFILYSQSERSQAQNKQDVIERLNGFVNEALKPEKKRVPTKPSRGAREKRLRDKERISRKKELRKPPKLGE